MAVVRHVRTEPHGVRAGRRPLPVHRARPALADGQAFRSHEAVADCLSAATTLWLPVYAAGAAVLVALAAWLTGRSRA
ncbi:MULTISPECIES: hypothetical protein [unclassified Streptomyces]|uniref:hypothetical protein n=1 Tax=unclassified Streptomyces TaxID=2593676 RepID=UPI001EF122E7|nr:MULTISPECIES: hypothetical protein [unclassified Streptomyces]